MTSKPPSEKSVTDLFPNSVTQRRAKDDTAEPSESLIWKDRHVIELFGKITNPTVSLKKCQNRDLHVPC